jgi:hypothetical protein
MRFTRFSRLLSLGVFAFVLFACGCVFAGVTASISGTVTDSSGAAVAGATVTATNVDTAVATTLTTNTQGFYSFQELPLGKYTVDVSKSGFKAYRETGLVLDVNSALSVNVALLVGQTSEKVEVTSSAIHVDTESTQMGEVITGKTMTDVPLVSRSYTDLLTLQPGVAPVSSGMNGASAGAFISAGFAMPLVSGSLDAGAFSVNGMREAANGYILNGVSVQETGYSGAGAVPNLDSISEFRIITNNFDAEYGNYSGGQINVVTKSGTNALHGSGFEFLRNTVLDAADYFVKAGGQNRGAYIQNQFGGTLGGAIKRDKIFFFGDYQGNRLSQAIPQTIQGAPTAATESGNFSAIASDFAGTTVNGAAWASQLTSQLGQPVTAGEPYYTPGCTTSAQCVFPNAQMPTSAINPISAKLLPYILPATSGINANTLSPGTGTFSTDSSKVSLDDNKFSGRVDANSQFGLLTAYYFWDKYNRVDPYWASNAPLYPGFSVDGNGLTQNINLGDTKTFSSAAVNEFRLGYFRLNTKFNQPEGGKETNALASLGFASGAGGAPGIFPGTPSVEGIPEIDFNSFVIVVPSRPNHIPENIYQLVDNFSKIIGTHSLKFGGQYHYDQMEENLSNVANGNFFFGTNFNGGTSETGSDFVDFLLGAPSSFVQGQSYPSYGRNFFMGLYAQDSWRVKSNLTINYGLTYSVSAPFKEKFNEIQTLIPGEQSVVFPGSPTGWLFPGDPGVPSTLAPTRWNNFGPRVGIAYSFGDHDGMLGKILGKPGTTSIRAGWGMFYSQLEGATDFNEIGDAPFGNYTGQFGSQFAAPFTNRATGVAITNLFPAPLPPRNFSASHPATQPPYDTLADFYSAFGTIGSSPAFFNKNRLPYAEDYELSFERQLTGSDLLTVSYVGTQGHRLLASQSANPGNPALCLQLTAMGATDLTNPGDTCAAGGHENDIYTLPNGSFALGTRTNFPGVALPAGTLQSNGQPVSGGITLPNGEIGIIPFGNDSYFVTGGVSAYNSGQIEWRHTSGRSQSLFAYTYSKSMDDSSGYGEQMNPFNNRLSRGLSAFDSTNNFVASYSYQLPFDKLGGPKRLTNGWVVSGITKFSTGLPVTMVETAGDYSLLGTSFGGPITLPVDTPEIVGPLTITNPRDTGAKNQFFSPSTFGPQALGTEGDSPRRWFHGPGLNNWDFALLKNTALTERVNLEFRAELFNVFNHTQFNTPLGLTGSGSFGDVTSDTGPRIGQLSMKLSF